MKFDDIIVSSSTSAHNWYDASKIVEIAFCNFAARNKWVRDAIPARGFAVIQSHSWYICMVELNYCGKYRTIAVKYNRERDYCLITESRLANFHAEKMRFEFRDSHIWEYENENRIRKEKLFV